MNLVDHGIHNEDSDFRVHVCFTARRIYVFPTIQAVSVMKGYRIVSASQWINGKKVTTSTGHIVPPDSIPGCKWAAIPHDILYDADSPMPHSSDTSQKGKAAVFVVQTMLNRGLIPLPQAPQIISDKDLQISGLDIVIKSGVKIQVKCDYKGGHREANGTGNLYLEIAERNPLKKY